MQMQRAFNSRMLRPISHHTISAGAYDTDNVWVEGAKVTSTIYGVIVAGNKFSQFDEGISLHSEDGGNRYSNYRSLYLSDRYSIELEDKLTFRGAYYNVLQESDEKVYGFASYILEKSEGGGE
jgi:hypothetical protein